MKPLSLVLACACLSLAKVHPSEDEINRQAEITCGRLENIDVDKCKRDAKSCVASSLKRNVSAEVERGDEVFWHIIQGCTMGGSINFRGDSPKNFGAFLDGNDVRIICKTLKKGTLLDCVEIYGQDIKEYGQDVQERCEEWGCRMPLELPDVCAENGGCDACKSGFGFKSGGSSEGGDGGDSLEDMVPFRVNLAFSCSLRKKDFITKSTKQRPLETHPAQYSRCDKKRDQKFEACWEKSRPYGFEVCHKEGQDEFEKCTGAFNNSKETFDAHEPQPLDPDRIVFSDN
ncbi:hypothetical protein VB005_00248 [Metarhizium brunneum]